jgi:hypothetical protein
MPVTVPIPAAKKLISTEQLEQWKDELAAWWDVETLRYDHKKMVVMFRNCFGVSKKEAIQMEFNSREEPEKFIEQFLNLIVVNFRSKFHKKKRVARLDVEMSFQHGAFAEIEFPAGTGQIHKHDVDGHVGIVGTVFYKDGTTQTVFQRFVSHPFWQYSHRSSN